ncbi:hypothetical protein A1O7_02700 [Cladophialophora yegresii CBS 114405]|uniref:Ubiquitin-like domain-containing protein n=1 Tax=Cladophialophora yegresii CBS 114405 TaxID=1182544 RepID=W9W2H9_9EURO|nr:uncharacterized protein A1O7_02700 [Cladophialophora yegresii CBS 114405]EXJ62267.1 hypothetical protein A1O7_02700 [Cladophialophora yegresii CBS 114405]
MDSSSSPSPPPQGHPPLEKDHVNLRVTYLVTGDPRPPHSLGNVHLNTTIADLRAKIRSELPEHPAPTEQRLIYQGRPLLRNEATLRDVLRIEPGQEAGPLPFTIHIVIQSPQPTPQPPPPAALPAMHPHLPADVANPLRAAEHSANRLQESLVRIQEQIEANRADLRSVQQRIAFQHTNLAGPPMAAHGHVNGQPLPNILPPGFPMNLPFGLPFAPQPQLPLPPTRTPHHPGQPANTPPASLAQHRPTGGTSTPNPAQQNGQIPYPQRVTVVTETVSIQNQAHRPSSAPGQRPPMPSQQRGNVPSHTPQTDSSTPAPVLPPPGWDYSTPTTLPPLPVPRPFAQPLVSTLHPSTATAWLMSSPTGPRALLFAPGHGYFSSLPPVATQQQQAGGALNPETRTSDTNPMPVPGVGQAADREQQGGDRAVIRADQLQPAGALAQAQQNGQENDLFAFLINRGWLFLRLYLFMFVFSEPGTWKRWLMIIVAAIVCLQPRDGPFTRLMRAARRHFDSLVGPPPRPGAVAPQRVDAAGQEAPAQRPANVRGAVQMTPQEAAARLIAGRQNNQDRPPRFWRDAFYRVEQSMALFLASLIPGVGERHVRAREEQRREEERRRAEAAAAAAAATAAAENQNLPQEETQVNDPERQSAVDKSEVNHPENGEQSTSSSVQARQEDGAGELRNRT